MAKSEKVGKGTKTASVAAGRGEEARAPLLGAVARVGVREYHESVTKVIREERPVVIERHGQPVGMYIPFKRRDAEREARLAAALAASLADLRAQSGLGEDDLAALIEDALKDG